MDTLHSRLTTRGRVSVPAAIRRKLGLCPGTVIEWQEVDGEVFVRRAGRYSSAEIHTELFSYPPEMAPTPPADGIRQYVRKRCARR